ncbi:hypothetical protein H9I45_03625 [Polaribacter haliotis]|uniref:Uncharacterized protein n=1 Tax=Polaribacter haliotis TaxID=1888915 RepID=A0A7L8AHS8_9FLAO|nr:hypothetical protein [Polaribacter haliotis]QOD61552.1 hypothetical protein H9I45_03625 [Polaribacter haliotis]
MAGIFFIFILLPISLILLITAGITNKKIFAQVVLYFWLFVIIISILGEISRPLFEKKVLEKSDFYGEYIIDRNYFSPKQADWQYNNFRFEIKENDSIYFYVTDGKVINETYKGKFSTRKTFTSERPKLEMLFPNHHILTTNPTVYREIWDFILVFNSPKFNNMYFRKGEWKEIN